MDINDAVDTFILILQGYIILNSSKVIAKMLAPGWPGTGKYAAFLFGHGLPHWEMNFPTTATIGRHQVNALDLRLEIMQQFLQQANGPVGIVSNCTVGDFDIEQHFLFLVGVGWLKIIT